MLYGLPWRLYDPAPLEYRPRGHPADLERYETNALSYFRQFRPIMPPIGHSIYVYHLTEEDVARVNPAPGGSAAVKSRRPHHTGLRQT